MSDYAPLTSLSSHPVAHLGLGEGTPGEDIGREHVAEVLHEFGMDDNSSRGPQE